MKQLLAGGVIIDNRNRMLLWRRNSGGKNRWELPGKLVESNETLEEAVSKSVEQRLGVDVWVGDIVYTTEFRDGPEHIKAELLTARITDAEAPQPLSPVIDRVGLFTLNTLEDLRREGRLSPTVVKFLGLIDRDELTLQDFTP